MSFKKKFVIISIFIICFCSCLDKKQFQPIVANNLEELKVKLSDGQLNSWFKKDIISDSIPGISLYRAYDSLLVNRVEKAKPVIVAVLDGELDLNHKDLKGNLWINNDEIPNNNIDDDKNGYTDDYQGWNFLGNLKGDNITYASIESVRILQQFKHEFEGKTEQEIPKNRIDDFLMYRKAKSNFEARLKSKQSDIDYGNFLSYGYPVAKKELKKIFPKENYDVKSLDSLYQITKETDKELAKHVYFVYDCLRYDITEQWIQNYKNNIDSSLSKTYNLNFYDRLKIDPKPTDLDYSTYGNQYLNKNNSLMKHSTKVSSLVLESVSHNDYSHKVQIMPLAISPMGSEHDKDIALSIRYAVDNGASIINMSFSKDMSLNEKWLLDAIEYANKNDVLIITSGGNSYENLDETNDFKPNDRIKNGKEISDNFTVVGSSSPYHNHYLFSYYSNYGKRDIDLFAPGEDIKVAIPNDEYTTDSGTSLSAAITSGVAALIRSYYPDLTASQVKHILMDSGIEYTIPVATPTEDDPDKMTPFNELSKSGKVLNAYNALIMADSISSAN